MKEERIKFYRPRKIALIGLAPLPSDTDKTRIELSEGTERWEVGIGEVDRMQGIEAILGEAKENECHPCVIKDMGDDEVEVELIVRYKEATPIIHGCPLDFKPEIKLCQEEKDEEA